METKTVSAEITTLKISKKQLNSFDEVVKVADLNYGYYSHLEQNEKCKNFIFAPIISSKEEEVILYWEGDNQVIPGGSDIYKYFADKGCEVISNVHSSLLIETVKELTEKKLEELGVPLYVNIVLPTPEVSLLPGEDGSQCFLEVCRGDGDRKLSLVDFDGEWHDNYAFLLRKIKI